MLKTTNRDIKEYFYAVDWFELTEEEKEEIKTHAHTPSKCIKIAYSVGQYGVNGLLISYMWDGMPEPVFYKIVGRSSDLFYFI